MKRFFMSILVAVVVTSMLAACAVPTPERVVETVVVEKEVEVEKVVKETVVVKEERPKLTVWMVDFLFPSANTLRYSQIYEWGAENDVDIEIVHDALEVWGTRMTAALETGDFGDVIINVRPGWAVRMHAQGTLLEITDEINELDSVGQGMLPAAKNFWDFDGDGRFWGSSVNSGFAAFHYRKDYLEEAGLPVKPADTWDELFEMGEKLNVPGERIGLALDFGCTADDDLLIHDYMLTFGAHEWDEDGKPDIDTPETIAFINAFKKAFDDGVIPQEALSVPGGWNNSGWADGSMAIVHNTTSIVAYMEENDLELLENSLIAPIPAGPAGRFMTADWGGIYGSANSEYPELAADLIKHMSHPDQLGPWIDIVGLLPPRPEMLDLPVFQTRSMQEFNSGAEFLVTIGSPGPVTSWMLEARPQNIPCIMFGKVMVDGWAPEDAAAWAQGELQTIYDQYH